MTYYEIDHKLSIYADSSEEKPTVYKTMSDKTLPIPGGSILYETDTSTTFMWNELKAEWEKQVCCCCCGGGSGGNSGGGSSASNTLIVTDDDGTLNKTFQEIYDAVSNGQNVIVRQKMLIPGDTPAYNLSMIRDIGPSWDGAPGNYTIATNNNVYYADTRDDYPSTDNGGWGPVK